VPEAEIDGLEAVPEQAKNLPGLKSSDGLNVVREAGIDVEYAKGGCSFREGIAESIE